MDRIRISVPDGVSGDWRVETFTVSQRESDFTRMRAAFGHPNEFVPPGTYKRLMHGHALVMSNTLFEVMSQRSVVSAAKGRVLLNGLGLGLTLAAILRKDGEVESVTVIEKEADVIKLVGPTYQADLRVKIIHDDAFTHRLRRGERYDVVWHDIWDDICGDNLGEMRRLKRKYARRAAWQTCWGYYETLRQMLH